MSFTGPLIDFFTVFNNMLLIVVRQEVSNKPFLNINEYLVAKKLADSHTEIKRRFCKHDLNL